MGGLKTLAVRMDRQCDNARTLAEHLQRDGRIGRVYYPGLPSASDADVARRMLRESHSGALVTIELKQNSRAAAFSFMNALKLCVRSTSLGDVFTTLLPPSIASPRDLTPTPSP